jgi:large subunit ribosomal protein L28
MMNYTRFLTNVAQRAVGIIATRHTAPVTLPIANASHACYSSIATRSSFLCVRDIKFPQSDANDSHTNRNQLQLQQQMNNDVVDEQRRFRSNRSRRGLYDGKDIRTGNNLSFSMKHTKRTFKPNVFIKRVYSEILDEMVRFHLTTSTLRTIDKLGGLDNYILTSKHITSGEGLKTKKRIVNSLKYKERKLRQTATTNNDTAADETMS